MTLSNDETTYQEEILPMVEEPNYYNQRGEIAAFYSGKKIFITGGLGFIGRLVMEKLLRCCPEITMVYLLIRAKKHKDTQTRFKEYINDVVFDRLKREQKNFEEKIVLIEGDLGKLNLGLSENDRELIKDTNVIIHSAASVRFTDKMNFSVNVNIKGTKDLLLLAQEMPNLNVFVYVSTAFSHCVNTKIEEKFYEPPLKTEDIIKLTEILSEDQLDDITPKLLGEWPNCYAYTKAICEDTVRQYSNGIPTCIVRPSLVLSTEKEPIAGWINNLYGLIGFNVGLYVGIIHTILVNDEIKFNIIPVDYVINNIIAAAWDSAQNRRSVSTSIVDLNNDYESLSAYDEIQIYNTISSSENLLSLRDLSKIFSRVGNKIPSTKMFLTIFFLFTENKYLYGFYEILFHWIPAIFADSLAYLTGNKPILLNTYKKISKVTAIINFFKSKTWEFDNDNVLNLWNKLSVIDKHNFFFNTADIDWNAFCEAYVRGIRVFILKDPIDTLEEALIKYKRLKLTQYTIAMFIFSLVIWMVYKLFYLFL